MKCFSHRELDAIAVCKHCGRALCFECVAESSGMSACKGRCEAGVAAVHSETQLNLHGFVLMVTMLRVVAFLCYAVGPVGVGVGVYSLAKGIGGREEPAGIALMSAGLIPIGLWFHHLARGLKRRAEKLP